MKAAVYTQYGPPEVLQIKELNRPIPKDNEVLVQVYASPVTTADVRFRKPDPALVRLMNGLDRPRKVTILGVELSGKVLETGKDVSRFKIGDSIFGSTFELGFGANVEYKCLPETTLIAYKPSNMSFVESAAIFFGAHTALHFLRKANISKGDRILIYGASGAIGTYAVQLAKFFGAEVTGVCSSSNLELVRSLGADHVKDYTSTDFQIEESNYSLVFDTVGKSPFRTCVKALKPKGYYLRAVHMSLSALLHGLWTSISTNKKVIGGEAKEHLDDLLYIRDLVEAGKLKPVIDRVYPFEQIAEAHAYVEQGHKKGNVVLDHTENKSPETN